jgi:uncharacterized repeat protein (TIGR03803 family)
LVAAAAVLASAAAWANGDSVLGANENAALGETHKSEVATTQAPGTGTDRVEDLDYSVRARFHRKHGPSVPSSGLTLASDGAFYGVSFRDAKPPTQPGGVYRMESGRITVLHEFAGNRSDPGNPVSEPIQASDGNFYGLTRDDDGTGSLYRIDSSGAYKVIHLFKYSEGIIFYTSPVQGADGRLYFAAMQGSTYGDGATLASTLDGDVQILHAFTGGADGTYPDALILADDGNFYGTTDGAGKDGTIFRMTPDGEVQTLSTLDFRQCRPAPFRMVDLDGTLYGVCWETGVNPGGVFRFTPQGDFSMLHQFDPRMGDGENPQGGLAVDPATGTFFGTTCIGGAYASGTIYKLSSDGTGYEIVKNFKHPHCPSGNLLFSPDGFIYGTTQEGGGENHGGTIFRFRP